MVDQCFGSQILRIKVWYWLGLPWCSSLSLSSKCSTHWLVFLKSVLIYHPHLIKPSATPHVLPKWVQTLCSYQCTKLAMLWPHCSFSCPYLLSSGPCIPFHSVTVTFPQTHRRPIASAKLDDLLSHEQASLVSLPKGKLMVLPSTSYHITLMVANLGPMHFSFHWFIFQGSFSAHKYANHLAIMESESQNKFLLPICYCIGDVCELKR